MPLMLRNNKKAQKILYSLIGKPPSLIPPKKTKEDEKVDNRLRSDLNNNLKP